MKKLSLLLCALAILYAPPSWAGDNAIGGLRKATGEAQIQRQGKIIAAEPGLAVYQNDLLVTGPDGSMGVMFKDNSTISLGPDSKLSITKYVFSPEDNSFSFLVKMIKGTAGYLSGIIGKLSPESVKFQTPQATIGIRGTRFLAKVDPE